jgi:DNA-binding NtrC family response regulator
MTGPAQSPTLLIVGADREGCYASPFAQLPWAIQRVPDCLQFLVHIFRVLPHVVLCDQDLPDGSWRDIVGIAETLYSPPPVIVSSRAADERLWAEVLNLGGFDLLAAPLDPVEVRRAVEIAWEHSTRQGRMHGAMAP